MDSGKHYLVVERPDGTEVAAVEETFLLDSLQLLIAQLSEFEREQLNSMLTQNRLGGFE